MSALSIQLNWQRVEPELVTGKYANQHTVDFNDKYAVQVDAAPDWGGKEENTNPEQAMAASLSSCHMMTFLALAAKAKWPVLSFTDQADAYLGKNAKGQMVITKIDLNPVVTFDEGFDITDDEIEKMHHRAHRYCFVANTLTGNVEMNINLPS